MVESDDWSINPHPIITEARRDAYDRLTVDRCALAQTVRVCCLSNILALPGGYRFR